MEDNIEARGKSNYIQEESIKNKKDDIKSVPSTIWKYIVSIFSFSNDKSINAIEVSETIKNDIEFKGPNVWILICSIIICSIGLNLNSIPVIVGAMLISPLMGPIRGLGLGVGTNNFKLIIFSLINFGVATVVSIIASYLYFKIMPFKDETPEILSRTEPLILDVLIAFFGGLAGIIAATRNNNSTVIPGVAIATALMPPLCVTGYGLATREWNFFFGASYLFILNSVFICLATIIVVRYLRFPLATYVNKKRERNIKIYIAIFLAIILIPSGYKFMEVFNKSVFNNTAKTFVKQEINDLEGIKIYKSVFDYKDQKITVFMAGNSSVSEKMKEQLQKELYGEQYQLDNCIIEIIQIDDIENNNFTMDDYRLMSKDWEKKIIDRDKKIKQLEAAYENKTDFNYNMKDIKKKLKFENDFEPIESFTAAKAYKMNMNGTADTTLLFVVNWNDSTLNKSRTSRLKEWIKINFETSNFEMIEKTK